MTIGTTKIQIKRKSRYFWKGSSDSCCVNLFSPPISKIPTSADTISLGNLAYKIMVQIKLFVNGVTNITHIIVYRTDMLLTFKKILDKKRKKCQIKPTLKIYVLTG